MSAEMNLKLIIKGLPFETTEDELCNFLDLPEEERGIVDLKRWHDSSRCKGHAIVNCQNENQYEQIMCKTDLEFEASGNCRQIKVEEFIVKSQRPRDGNRSNQREQREKPQPNFLHDDNSPREVYVSNVSFKATEDDFRRVFSQYGDVEDVTIPKIYSSDKPKGFAFVRFTTEEDRNAAIDGLHGSEFLSREITVRANRGRAKPPQNNPRRKKRKDRSKLSDPTPGSTTIFVGDLPWSADEEDLEDCFNQFGEIQNKRVVRKSWTAKSRGFGYVEFVDVQAVENAINSRGSVEIGGRTVHIDYAEPMKENRRGRNEEN